MSRCEGAFSDSDEILFMIVGDAWPHGINYKDSGGRGGKPMTNSFPHVDSQQRLERARASLEGLSVGDAFGERFFVSPSIAEDLIEQRALPAPPWPYTDDTAMAISIVEALQHSGAIDQDWLATAFTEAYVRDPSRGYGPAMHSLFGRILARTDTSPLQRPGIVWQRRGDACGSVGRLLCQRSGYGGKAGRAFRQRDASVTHAHPESVAGAIAGVAAAAWAWRLRDQSATTVVV